MDKTVLDSSGYESDIENCPSVEINGPPRNRRRRDRTQFTDKGLHRLEEVFKMDRYPDVNIRESLADELGVTEDRIQVWFQNRRSKHRRRLQTSNSSNVDLLGGRSTRNNFSIPATTQQPIPNMATMLNPWQLPFLNGVALPSPLAIPFINHTPATMLTKSNDKNSSNTIENSSLDLSTSSGSTRPDSPSSETETPKIDSESSVKNEDKGTNENTVKTPTTAFKRPWEVTTSSQLRNRSVTDSLNVITPPLHLPLQMPPFMLAAPPVLPFSQLGNPGTGILFLPSSLQRDMYCNY